MTEGGGERVIECGKTGGYGRAEGGEGRDELLFGVVVLVEEGDGVKVVLLLLTTSFLLSVIIVPPFVVFFFFRCIVGSFSLFGRRRSRVISTIGGEIKCVEKSVG
jgi:hypothetical protein